MKNYLMFTFVVAVGNYDYIIEIGTHGFRWERARHCEGTQVGLGVTVGKHRSAIR